MDEFDRDEKDLGDRTEEPEIDDLLGLMAEGAQPVKVLGADVGLLRNAHGEKEIRRLFISGHAQELGRSLLRRGDEEGGHVVVFIGGPVGKIEGAGIRLVFSFVDPVNTVGHKDRHTAPDAELLLLGRHHRIADPGPPKDPRFYLAAVFPDVDPDIKVIDAARKDE